MNTILQKRIVEAARIEREQCREDNNEIWRGNPTYNDVEASFIKGATFTLQNQWISVEEALPECDKCHLAMYEDGGIVVAKYENETWWWQDGFVVDRNTDGDLMYSSSCKVPSGLITHWMSIPQIGGEE